MLLTRFAMVAAAAASVLIGTSAQAAVFSDDFTSGSLANYTATRILDAGGAAGVHNTTAWQVTAGAVEFNTSVYDGIEQGVLIRNSTALAIGEELQVDITRNTASQDLGLYVGGSGPTTDVRSDHVNIYARSNGQIFSRGFGPTTELSLAGGGTAPYTSLFITRTGAGDYELGFYNGATRTVVSTRTGLANDGDVVGLYTDVRAAGVVGTADNLRIIAIPEPAALSLLGLGGVLAGRRRRA